MDHIVNSHFSAFSHLLRAAKDPIEDFLEEQFQIAEEKIHSQFKMEKMVYSQDELYSSQLDTVKQKSSTGFGHHLSVQMYVRCHTISLPI